jgi:3-phenylpropionate/cinnamic acid dioxygenase small subunit
MLTTADRLEIHETLALHAHLLDTDQFERLDELFTPDAVYDMTKVGMGEFSGRETIAVAAARLAASGRSPIAHFVTNILIMNDSGDEVSTLSKGLMIHADGRIEGVTHEDTLRRHDGGWRISRRVIVPAHQRAAAGPSDEDARPVAR